MATPPANLHDLAPPPRTLSRPLALRVWLHGAVVAGVVGVGLASLGFLFVLRYAEVPAEWRLWRERREARGWVTSVQKHETRDRKQGRQVTSRYTYVFDLPNGQRVSGTSSNSGSPIYQARGKRRLDDLNRPADVTIEYHPSHPEANRLKGTHADRGELTVLLGLILPALALALTGHGLRLAWIERRLLRHGAYSEGYVQQCRLRSQASGGKVQAGDFGFSWKSSTSGFVPIAEFRDWQWQLQREAIEKAQAMDRSRLAKGCGMLLAILFAFACGGAFGGLLLALALFGILAYLGMVGNGQEVTPMVVAGVVGWLLGGSLVLWWMIRESKKSIADERLTERPKSFDQVDCQVTFVLEDGESTGEIRRTVRLEGTEADEQPHPLLYDPAKPTRALLASELTVPVTVEQGEWHYAHGWPLVRVAWIVLGLALPVVGWFLI